MTVDLHLANHPAMPVVGDRLAHRYEILSVIAEGGTSVVYAVRDHLAGGRLAIKVLSPRKSRDPVFSARFRDEAMLLRKLSHPNTVRVADVGETEAGCLYLVQELLEGEDLAERIEREGSLDEDQTVHLLSQVLKALGEAHDLGIVHRDLKPQNLMICQFAGDEDFVKVLDFGIAKQLDGGRLTPGTSPNEVLFTPQYAAPELLNGGAILPAADVYALGLIALEMLTGQQVVSGSTIWQIIAIQIGPAAIEIPPEVESLAIASVIRKAVAKRTEERFKNAQAMLRALESPEVVRFAPTLAPPPAVKVGPPSAESEGRQAWMDSSAAIEVRWAEARKETAGVPGSPPAPGPAAWSSPPGPSAEHAPWQPPAPSAEHPPWRPDSAPSGAAEERVEGLEESQLSPSPSAARGEEASRAGATPGGGRTAIIVGVALVAAGAWLAVTRFAGEAPTEPAAGTGEPVAAVADPPVAGSPARERCRGGDWAFCVDLATGAAATEGVGLGLAEAVELLGLACETGRHLPACSEIARRHRLNMGITPEEVLAARAVLCEADEAEACWRAGYDWLNGVGVERDPERARPLLERSCEAGEAMGCAGLASIVANGWGVDPDPVRAAVLYQQACEGGVVVACTRLGGLRLSGVGGDARQAEARQLFQRGCDGGDASGCANLAMMLQRGLGGAVDDAQAAELYGRACNANALNGCAGLATLYELGRGVETDLERAHDLYERACDGGAGTACFRLANLEAGSDAEAAREYLQRACEAHYEPACEALPD